ncbi:novel putative transporter 1 [Hepatocystis sp. ex Piliocolobus tephrosceles]|nr:novel putative transporter 1 [Hepatocystis sp. ex Piliocolobus tephrosceles]
MTNKKLIKNKISNFFKQLWIKTDPNLPGARQKIPLNISRFYLLIIIFIYTSVSASIYFDWTSVRSLLLNVGKYKDLNLGPITDVKTSPQYIKINSLHPITLATHFTMSAFCGILYDHMGPKFTAILGQTFNIISWILLSLDVKTIDTTLIGFIFMGLGADTAFIPILTIANLYPDASTFILTVVGAAASLSFAIPTTLNAIRDKYTNLPFSYICYGYILFILVPCLLIAIFCLPLKPFKGIDYYTEINEELIENEQIKIIQNKENKWKKQVAYVSELADDDDVEMQQYNKNNNKNIINNNLHEDDNITNTNVTTTSITDKSRNLSIKKRDNSNIYTKTKDINLNVQTLLLESSTLSPSVSSPSSSLRVIPKHEPEKKKSISNYDNIKKMDDNIEINYTHEEESFKQNFILFLKVLISYPSICIITYFIIFNISIVFYAMVTETYFSYDLSITKVINILLPLSCIPCIIFGRFINKYGASTIILLINALSALMHLTGLIKHKAFGLTSAIMYMCANSIYTSQIYCFIQNAFPSVIFGKLLGFASMCGGLSTLICIKMYDHAAENKDAPLDPSDTVHFIVIIFIIMFFPLSIMHMKKYERTIEKSASSMEESIKN